MTTRLHKNFSLLKKLLPNFLSDFIRKSGTAFLTPLRFSLNSGHFKSSFQKKSVDKHNNPIPWYTYPCIDFLKFIDFKNANILEFGAGQSTLWWAQVAKTVTSMEGDKAWFKQLEKNKPSNVDLNLVSLENPNACVVDIESFLKLNSRLFDVIVIDGLFRTELIAIAKNYVAQNGMIICDNAEGYGFQEAFIDSDFKRIDFYGHAPGVILPHCTAIFFRDNCSFLSSNRKIHNIALGLPDN